MKNRKLDGSDFVCCVSEMVGGMNERGISIDMVKLLEESWIEMECKDDDLKYIKECFEDDWNNYDCGWWLGAAGALPRLFYRFPQCFNTI